MVQGEIKRYEKGPAWQRSEKTKKISFETHKPNKMNGDTESHENERLHVTVQEAYRNTEALAGLARFSDGERIRLIEMKMLSLQLDNAELTRALMAFQDRLEGVERGDYPRKEWYGIACGR